MSSFDFAPFYRSTVGFDRLFSTTTLGLLAGSVCWAFAGPSSERTATGTRNRVAVFMADVLLL